MNVYAAKFTCVLELKHKVGEDAEGNPTFETQRISGKEGSINILADSPQAANTAAVEHLKTEGVIEVNVHLVHEIAKNVIIHAPDQALEDESEDPATEAAAEPDVATLLQQAEDNAQEPTEPQTQDGE